MPIEVDWLPVRKRARSERNCDPPRSDARLGAALCVAESIARLHGGEVRLRSRDDGGILVELRFPIPALPA